MSKSNSKRNQSIVFRSNKDHRNNNDRRNNSGHHDSNDHRKNDRRNNNGRYDSNIHRNNSDNNNDIDRYSNDDRQNSKSYKKSSLKPHKVEAVLSDLKGARQVIGIHSCREALKVRPRSIRQAWFRSDWKSHIDLQGIHDELVALKINVLEKPLAALDNLATGHQGVALFVNEQPRFEWDKILSAEKSIVMLLDGLEDPHNLGAIMRTAWLLGVTGILIPKDRAVGLTPTVHKVASGGVEHVPIESTSDLIGAIKSFKDAGFWIFGLAGEGEQNIFDLKFPEKIVWIVGAEDKGIRSGLRKQCDHLVRIPQVTSEASFNASVSAAIALSETVRQRK